MKKGCNTCENCMPIGGGDFVCMSHQVTVMEEYTPNKYWMVCKGKNWEPMDG